MDFQIAADEKEQQMSQIYSQYMGGKSFDPEQRKKFKMEAMQELIDRELMAQAARKAGILATDTEIKDLITQQIPAFQKDGQFQRENYDAYLQSQGLTPSGFEGKIRKQLGTARLFRLFEASSRTLSLEADKKRTLQNYKMNLQVVKFDDDKPATQAVSTEEAQKALANEDFKKKIEAEFALKKGQLSQPEQVHAQHILIAFKSGDAASEKAAQAKIEAIKARTTKEDFGTLASQTSEDPGSKAKKGDLGFFGRGAMVKEFADAAFALPPGHISEIVKSPYGYHLIKVLEKKEAQEATLADHQLSLAKETLAKEKWQKKSQELEALLNSDPAKIETEVKNLNAKWEETGFFSLDAPAIPKVSGLEIEKVAGLTAKEPFLKSFVRSGTSRYIVKLKELKQDPSAPQITADLSQRQRANGIFTSWLQAFKKGSDIETNSLIFQ